MLKNVNIVPASMPKCVIKHIKRFFLPAKKPHDIIFCLVGTLKCFENDQANVQAGYMKLMNRKKANARLSQVVRKVYIAHADRVTCMKHSKTVY